MKEKTCRFLASTTVCNWRFLRVHDADAMSRYAADIRHSADAET
jgi:hypothetical protein